MNESINQLPSDTRSCCNERKGLTGGSIYKVAEGMTAGSWKRAYRERLEVPSILYQ